MIPRNLNLQIFANPAAELLCAEKPGFEPQHRPFGRNRRRIVRRRELLFGVGSNRGLLIRHEVDQRHVESLAQGLFARRRRLSGTHLRGLERPRGRGDDIQQGRI